jgi:hypothetical protein
MAYTEFRVSHALSHSLVIAENVSSAYPLTFKFCSAIENTDYTRKYIAFVRCALRAPSIIFPPDLQQTFEVIRLW